MVHLSAIVPVGRTSFDAREGRCRILKRTTRRTFLRASLGAGAALLGLGCDRSPGTSALAGPNPFGGGNLLEVLPFPYSKGYLFHTPQFKKGLHRRLFTDLSVLDPVTLVTPTEQFFIRTGCPLDLDTGAPWKIRLTGLVKSPLEIALEELRPLVKPMGHHLLECSGSRFRYISAAQWSGVALDQVLGHAEPLPEASRIRIAGFDPAPGSAKAISAGADWIFTPDQLCAAGAFLATEMNGQTLIPDHGFPIRLVVPGWYGCVCIKWLNEIEWVGEDSPSTEQMKEFAGRTHQDGVPELARDFEPATIDPAAMAVRVEKWRVRGKIRYRVMGIGWGGPKPTKALEVRFHPNEAYQPVHHGAPPLSNTSWAPWWHAWQPSAVGLYEISLRVADSTVRTRRLDTGYYNRKFQIDEV